MRTPLESISLLLRRTDSRGGWLGHGVLVVLGLVTVAGSLALNQRQMAVDKESQGVHQAWSERLARYGRLGPQALAVSAPCNEVFDSGDLPAEVARSQQARAALAAELDSARLEVAHVRRASTRSLILRDLDAVDTAIDAMVVDVDRTFASFDVGTPPEVAVINGHLARINDALLHLGRHAREAQALETRELLASSTSLNRLIAVLMTVIVIVVIGSLVRRLPGRQGAAPESEETHAAHPPIETSKPRPNGVVMTHSTELEVAPATHSPIEDAHPIPNGASLAHAQEPETSVPAPSEREALNRPGLDAVEEGPPPRWTVDHRLEPESEVVEGPRPRWTPDHGLDAEMGSTEAPRPTHEQASVRVPPPAPLRASLSELLRGIEGQQPGMVCMVLAADVGLLHLHVVASPSLTDDLVQAIEHVEVGPSTCSWGAAVHTRRRVIVEDTATHPLWFQLRRLAVEHGLRSSLAEPILSVSGHAIGVLLAFRRRVHVPDESEIELLASAAHLARLAIERAGTHGRAEAERAADSGHVVVWSHAEVNGVDRARAA